jgi:hypothetical protein
MHQLKFLKTVVPALLLLWSTANAQDPRAGKVQEDTLPVLQE